MHLEILENLMILNTYCHMKWQHRGIQVPLIYKCLQIFTGVYSQPFHSICCLLFSSCVLFVLAPCHTVVAGWLGVGKNSDSYGMFLHTLIADHLGNAVLNSTLTVVAAKDLCVCHLLKRWPCDISAVPAFQFMDFKHPATILSRVGVTLNMILDWLLDLLTT
jgi:hypothetical protein